MCLRGEQEISELAYFDQLKFATATVWSSTFFGCCSRAILCPLAFIFVGVYRFLLDLLEGSPSTSRFRNWDSIWALSTSFRDRDGIID
jgi:hypothetical protein